MTSRFLIYALVDPRDGSWRYVGKSSSGMKRPKAHGSASILKVESHLPVHRWIKKLRSMGLEYQILVLEEVTKDGLAEAECEWIAACRRQGISLLNLTDGGEGALGYKQPPDVVEKRIAPLRGRKYSEAQCRAMSERMRGVRPSAVARQKISQSLTGRKQSEETREKRSRSLSFRVRPPRAHKQRVRVRHWSTGGFRAGAPAGKPVVDDLGQRYASCGAAARALGVDRALVRRVVQGKQKSVRGRTFAWETA